mmetsp:Transcript_12500/g.13910  ORF Transcript_12500/g.13910 Transcript_12500/m.13910 type:complete len:254 (+) Transcript_12500:60-821(+)|eukprot:CAMPEP_0194135418 /NCGR_PEP_ID=MMETSP0152-20130528/5514_1 /TAXON_ID=1049557 /ORGANISM="Thalassiothrix antarctica, Strain L6-D1" /LENGTH=253 /DNA_ID=CAMNT_0038831653 /DNA_START=21 /DNA_END=782 /DNA_ORIENTATION=+
MLFAYKVVICVIVANACFCGFLYNHYGGSSILSSSPKVQLLKNERVAQFGENSITVKGVLPRVEHIKKGTFIEMGANDGLNSNSHYLEQNYGWRGLCIEAGPANHRQLTLNRPNCRNINAVVSDGIENQKFREFTGGLYGHSGFVDGRTDAEWSGLIRAHPTEKYHDWDVKTNTMSGILKENDITNVDYFSLDVEGYEMKILNSYPFEIHPVTVWTIESNKLDRKALLDFMEKRNYECKHYDKVNTICELNEA